MVKSRHVSPIIINLTDPPLVFNDTKSMAHKDSPVIVNSQSIIRKNYLPIHEDPNMINNDSAIIHEGSEINTELQMIQKDTAILIDETPRILPKSPVMHGCCEESQHVSPIIINLTDPPLVFPTSAGIDKLKTDAGQFMMTLASVPMLFWVHHLSPPYSLVVSTLLLIVHLYFYSKVYVCYWFYWFGEIKFTSDFRFIGSYCTLQITRF